jgi:5-methylcytosine-specific restriction endonuclease McrA
VNDRRYGTRRWKRVRLQVLHRDLWACWVTGCGISASVADHIEPVYPEMPDSQFFDRANLRASCKRHNTARGVAARLEREVTEGVSPADPPHQRRARFREVPMKPRVY